MWCEARAPASLRPTKHLLVSRAAHICSCPAPPPPSHFAALGTLSGDSKGVVLLLLHSPSFIPSWLSELFLPSSVNFWPLRLRKTDTVSSSHWHFKLSNCGKKPESYLQMSRKNVTVEGIINRRGKFNIILRCFATQLWLTDQGCHFPPSKAGCAPGLASSLSDLWNTVGLLEAFVFLPLWNLPFGNHAIKIPAPSRGCRRDLTKRTEALVTGQNQFSGMRKAILRFSLKGSLLSNHSQNSQKGALANPQLWQIIFSGCFQPTKVSYKAAVCYYYKSSVIWIQSILF